MIISASIKTQERQIKKTAEKDTSVFKDIWNIWTKDPKQNT